MDIAEFEQRLRKAKKFGDLDGSDSDDDIPNNSYKSRPSNRLNIISHKSYSSQQREKAACKIRHGLKRFDVSIYLWATVIVSFLVTRRTKTQTKNQQPSKIQKLQEEISKVKYDNRPKTEEEKTLELIATKNETAKDKKLKELVQKNKELYVSYEKEKTA
jgi:hypothetical protein